MTALHTPNVVVTCLEHFDEVGRKRNVLPVKALTLLAGRLWHGIDDEPPQHQRTD